MVGASNVSHGLRVPHRSTTYLLNLLKSEASDVCCILKGVRGKFFLPLQEA